MEYYNAYLNHINIFNACSNFSNLIAFYVKSNYKGGMKKITNGKEIKYN